MNSEQRTVNREQLTDIFSQTIFQEYLSYLEAVKGCSERTIEAYKNDLTRYANYCNNFEIDPAVASPYEVQKFIADLSCESMAGTSVNRCLSSIRGFYRWMIRFKKREDNPCSELKNVKTSQKLPSFLKETEMAGFASLPDTAGILWPQRDKALILSMYSGGLRISEIVSLTVKDMSEDLCEARIIGKGGKMRYVFFSMETVEALEEYIIQRNARLKMAGISETDGALFINRKGKPISIPGVRWIISCYAKSYGLGKNIHPHALRHSFATHMVNSGCDVRVVQEMLGHSSISTTQRYTHISVQKMKETYAYSHPHANKVSSEQ